MKTILKLVAALVLLVVVAFGVLAVFVSTLDADKYRPQLVKVLTEKTGREVRLDGPISFSMALTGIEISAEKASIANPAWASRPEMASLGKFELGVGILPLLAHKIDINELAIENADILLETNAAGAHNWDMGGAAKADDKAKKEEPKKDEAKESGAPVGSLSIDSLTVKSSKLGMRGADGKTSLYRIDSFSLGMAGSGATLKFKGEANDAAVTLAVKTSIKDLLSKAPFNFDADATYGAFQLSAQGKADLKGGEASVDAYRLTAGQTTVTGNAVAVWSGPRPSVRGKINSDKIDPADFKPKSDVKEGGSGDAKAAAPSNGRLFSDAPLPLDGLRAADADFDIAVGQYPMGTDMLKDISAKLTLTGGNLTLAPVRASVGATPVELQIRLNAASAPARLTFGLSSKGVDLGDLQKLGGMSPFMAGKAGADIQLTGEGNSMHALASSLGGVINVTAEKGEILSGAAASVSSALATLFNPKGGDSALNCLAVRFIAQGGVLQDNGLLIDSATTTVSGKGTVNLGAENVSMLLRAKTKLANVGGLVPPLQVNGPLSHPGYSLDAASTVKNVVGNLLSGTKLIAGDSGVPDIQASPAGQNACVYTLDHPKAQPSAGASVLPADAVGKATQKVQDLGNSLVTGLFGQ